MRIVVLFVVLCFAVSPSFASDEDAKLKAAKRYLETTPISEMIIDMANKMAASIPSENREQFIRKLTKEVDIKKLEQATLAAMMQTFTLDELKAFADFYGSKEGRSAMAKFGTYMSRVMPAVQQEIMRAIQTVK